MDFYKLGAVQADITTGLNKVASLQQLLYSLENSPAIRAEMLRGLIGGGIGAAGGGIAGSQIGDEENTVRNAVIGALLGGTAGSIGARSLGRLQESRVLKNLRKRRGNVDDWVPKSDLISTPDYIGAKKELYSQIIPRTPKWIGA